MRQVEQMKKRKRRMKHLTAVLAAAGLLAMQAALPVSASEAAGSDTLEEALAAGLSVTVTSPEGDAYAQLVPGDVTVDLYRIAEAVPLEGVDAYEFVWDETFAEQRDSWNKTEKEAQAQDKAPTATDVDTLTQSLAGVVLKDIPEYKPGAADAEAGTPATAPAYTGTLGSAVALADGGKADPGMYLIIAHGAENAYKILSEDGQISTAVTGDTMLYQFAPMLVTLPARGMAVIGEGTISDFSGGWPLDTYAIQAGNTTADAKWQNAIEIAAKVGAAKMLGSLKITKTLTSHEAVKPEEKVGTRIDQSTFIFDVSVTFHGEVIYSNVISMVFDGTKMQDEKIITGLPIGAEAKVTEVYAGGNYRQSGEPVWNLEKHLIVGDNPTTPEEEILTAAFTNDYSDTWKGGGSVTNSYNTIKKTSSEEEKPDWNLNTNAGDGKVGQTYAGESAASSAK